MGLFSPKLKKLFILFPKPIFLIFQEGNCNAQKSIILSLKKVLLHFTMTADQAVKQKEISYTLGQLLIKW